MRAAAVSVLAAALSCAGCSQAHAPRPPAQETRQSATAADAARDARQESPKIPGRIPQQRPRPAPGGKRVPNSSVYLPPSAAPGAVVHGRAPVGSRVEFLGADVAVQDDGGFSITLPPDARGRIPVRIVRPEGQTPITLHIEAGAP